MLLRKLYSVFFNNIIIIVYNFIIIVIYNLEIKKFLLKLNFFINLTLFYHSIVID